MRFSVVVPAHNEEQLLPRGLAAIEAAGAGVDGAVEMIVVANRCNDSTAPIAGNAGAVVVNSDARNIAAVRNAGAAVATGDVIVTVDADCVMSPEALAEIERLLGSGRYVGGGTKARPERNSAGIRATLTVMEVITFIGRVSGAMFWCRRSDFEAIGGFDERLVLAEDIDFARRLRAHGRRTGRKFTTLRTAPLTFSTRKFDRFGDWHMFAMALHLREIRAAFKGTDTSWVDHYFFDFNDQFLRTDATDGSARGPRIALLGILYVPVSLGRRLQARGRVLAREPLGINANDERIMTLPNDAGASVVAATERHIGLPTPSGRHAAVYGG